MVVSGRFLTDNCCCRCRGILLWSTVHGKRPCCQHREGEQCRQIQDKIQALGRKVLIYSFGATFPICKQKSSTLQHVVFTSCTHTGFGVLNKLPEFCMREMMQFPEKAHGILWRELPLEHEISSRSPFMQNPAMKPADGMRVCSMTPLLR